LLTSKPDSRQDTRGSARQIAESEVERGKDGAQLTLVYEEEADGRGDREDRVVVPREGSEEERSDRHLGWLGVRG